MHRPRVRDEVESGPRMPSKEFCREQVALQPVAASAGEDEVPAGHVRAAVGEWMNVVERGDVEVEQRRAVDAPATSRASPHA